VVLVVLGVEEAVSVGLPGVLEAVAVRVLLAGIGLVSG
jgi:hypothetical protein